MFVIFFLNQFYHYKLFGCHNNRFSSCATNPFKCESALYRRTRDNLQRGVPVFALEKSFFNYIICMLIRKDQTDEPDHQSCPDTLFEDKGLRFSKEV